MQPQLGEPPLRTTFKEASETYSEPQDVNNYSSFVERYESLRSGGKYLLQSVIISLIIYLSWICSSVNVSGSRLRHTVALDRDHPGMVASVAIHDSI
jgi:hypothetical protein